MKQIIIDAEAGQLSAELTRRGVAVDTRVLALVHVRDDPDLPLGVIAQTGKGFD